MGIDLLRIAELHLDGNAAAVALLGRDPEAAKVLAALDRVVRDLQALRPCQFCLRGY